MERIEIGNDICLVKQNGKYHPCRLHECGHLIPIRGYNKKGNLCWRSYKTVEEAKQNLFNK
jgi:hypothetical protein